MTFDRLVQDLGEQGLLQRLQRYCPVGVVGDDAALLTVAADQSLVVTTDVLVDGVHFSLGLAVAQQTTTPADAGWRAIAANLSDLAAMGAMPLGVTVGLGLPGTVPVAWVEALYDGMADCGAAYGTAIVGGDICRSPVVTVAITALGQVAPEAAWRRSAAQVGDILIATGDHGASRAGLDRLLHPRNPCSLSLPAQARLIRAHQRPRPRLDLVPTLQAIAAGGRAIAAMDSSDGLADAVVQLCRASGVGAQIERSHLPQPPEFAQWPAPEQALDWTLYGGEDFELVLAVPPELASAVVAQCLGARPIGQITPGSAIVLVESHGGPPRVLSLQQGFQHFQG
jgi:thiamine-monophosphate kinase